MSHPLQTSDRTAFDRFDKLGPCGGRWAFSDGDLYAFVSVQGGSWVWVVWRDGRPIGGRRDFEMDAFFACQEALEFIDKVRGYELAGPAGQTRQSRASP